MQTLESKIRKVLAQHKPTEREKTLLSALKQTLTVGLIDMASRDGGCGGPDYYSGQAGGTGGGGNTQYSNSPGGYVGGGGAYCNGSSIGVGGQG